MAMNDSHFVKNGLYYRIAVKNEKSTLPEKMFEELSALAAKYFGDKYDYMEFFGYANQDAEIYFRSKNDEPEK